MVIVKVMAEAGEKVRRLPKEIRNRVLKLMERLEDWPNVSGVKALSGNLAGLYRMRTGDYRLLFRIAGNESEEGEDEVILIIVEKIGHRKDIYED